MIELEALKEQLKLLGHDLPDDQIVHILRDMNIELNIGDNASSHIEPSSSSVNSGSLLHDFRTAPADSLHSDATYDNRHEHHHQGSLTLAGQGNAQPWLSVDDPGRSLHPNQMDSNPHSSYQPPLTLHGSSSTHPSLGMHADMSTGLGAEELGTHQLSSGFSNLYVSRDSEPGPHPPHEHQPDQYRSAAPTSSRDDHQPRQTQDSICSSSQALSSEPSFPHGFEADTAAAPCVPKHPYEWYGQLAGVAGNPHLSLSQPKTSQRSLLQELDMSAERRRGQGAGAGAGSGLLAAGLDSLQNSFWEEDEEEEEEEEAGGRVQPLRTAFPMNGVKGGSRLTSSASASAAAAAGLNQQRARSATNRPTSGSILNENFDPEEARSARVQMSADDACDVRQAQDARARARVSGMSGSEYTQLQLQAQLKGGIRPNPKASMQAQPLDTRQQAWHAGEAAAAGPGLGPSAGSERAAFRAAAAAAGAGSAARASGPAAGPSRPGKYQWQEHLRSTSPTHSSVISLPRSSAAVSAAGSGSSSRAGAGGKKIDRVKRYQELQQSWSKDSFLKYAQGSKPNTSARQPSASTRKPSNFHAYFSVLHAIEAADRNQMLKQTRSKTQVDLKPGVAYEAPTSKRRDALRWEMRMRMQQPQP